jgi:hypothetical protein
MSLTKFSTFQANYPGIAMQLTQVLQCVKGSGTNDIYVAEMDPATGGMPITITPTPLVYVLNGSNQNVVQDDTVPANNRPLPIRTFGRTKANAPVRYDYTVNVTTSAYVQLVASTSAATNRLQIFDSSGQTLVLAVGGAGAEVDQLFIFPGGIDIDYYVPAGSRVSIKAVSASATTGECSINFLS